MSEAKQMLGYYQLRFGVAIDQDVALWPNDRPLFNRKNVIITDESKKKRFGHATPMPRLSSNSFMENYKIDANT